MAKSSPAVAVIMGSQSDWETMKHAVATLRALDIPCEAEVISAHRNADRLAAYCAEAKARGLKVIIAGAGMAAALPGVVAAATPLPVLGVPIESKLGGLDSLLSMSQMPAGVPVGTLAVGRSGAVNAALLAAAILALADAAVAERLDAYRREQSARRVDLPDLEG